MSTFAIVKDPDADLDYSIDWTAWLTGAEVISTSAWTVTPVESSGIVLHGAGVDGTNKIATVWISGGTLRVARRYSVVNSIVTTSTPPRSEQRTILVDMEVR